MAATGTVIVAIAAGAQIEETEKEIETEIETEIEIIVEGMVEQTESPRAPEDPTPRAEQSTSSFLKFSKREAWTLKDWL